MYNHGTSAAREHAIDLLFQDDFVTNMPLIRRANTVDDLAGCAIYLASDEPTGMTGQHFGGGVTAGTGRHVNR